MIIGVMALGKIVGVCVGEEGFRAEFLDSADDVMYKAGLNVVGVAEFTHVDFDGYQVTFLYATERSGFVIESVCFLH